MIESKGRVIPGGFGLTGRPHYSIATHDEPSPDPPGPSGDLIGIVGSGLRGAEAVHADRPPTAEEAKAVLAASLGIDVGELRSLSAEGATMALERLNDLVRRLAEQAATDELTGVLRRGAGYAVARAEIQRARRNGGTLTLAVVDVDGLKRINDTAGHLEGDRALRRVAGALLAAMRPYDVVIRFGGDEFLCVLGGVTPAKARARLTTIRAKLAAGSEPVSISVGLAELRDRDSLDDLIRRADAHLYWGRRRRRHSAEGGRETPERAEAGRSRS